MMNFKFVQGDSDKKHGGKETPAETNVKLNCN